MYNKCDNQTNKSYIYFVKLNLILDKMQKYMEKKLLQLHAIRYWF